MKQQALSWWNNMSFQEQADAWEKWKSITEDQRKDMLLVEFDRDLSAIEAMWKELTDYEFIKTAVVKEHETNGKKRVLMIGAGSISEILADRVISDMKDAGIDVEITDKLPERESYKEPSFLPYKNVYEDLVPVIRDYQDDNSMLPRDLKNAKIVDVRTEPKIGRNQPCSCGSGKKYKNCCL